MGFLIFWVGSIVVSFFVEMTVVMKVFKTVCEEGYKVDINNSKKAFDSIVPEDNNKHQKMILLTPGINLIHSFNFSITCMQSLDQLIDQFDAVDSLVRMTSAEQQKFEARPTLMTALLITCEYAYSQLEEESLKQDYEYTQKKLEEDPLKQEFEYDYYISIDTNEEKSEYYYKYTEDGEDIIVVKAVGDAEKLSLEEQNNNIKKYLSVIIQMTNPEDQEKGQKLITENFDVELAVDKYLQLLEGENHQVEEKSKSDEEKPKQYEKRS